MATPERTSYCLPCDRVVRWKSWRTWKAHLGSAEHRECVLAPRPLPPDRLRPADLDDRLYGLAEGESVVFRRPDGRWIGLASLGDGASLRIEDKQRTFVLERLISRLGPEASEPKQLCMRCLLILDPVIVGHHNTSRSHRGHKEPDVEAEAVVPAVRQAEPELGPAQERAERFTVTMAPLTLTVADAARVIGLSRSTISELARSGTIPSLRIGTRILVPVKALELWIEDRLKEDSMRYAAPWSRLRDYVAMPMSSGSSRRRPQR
jgi:excisionase family DNA binding protein